jgi:hypothetical protein
MAIHNTTVMVPLQVVSRNLFGAPASATHTWLHRLEQLKGDLVSFKPNGTAINLADRVGPTINNNHRKISDSVDFRVGHAERANPPCHSAPRLQESLYIDNDRVARIVTRARTQSVLAKQGVFMYIVNTRTNQVEKRMDVGLLSLTSSPHPLSRCTKAGNIHS